MPACAVETDVLVVGAGAAGLCAALNAAPRRVVLLGPVGAEASSTALAKGGIAAAVSPGDSVDLHVADTLLAADHSGYEPTTRLIIGSARQAVEFLTSAGVRFDGSHSHADLHLEAGHQRPRVLHADGDRTGAAIHRALLARARGSAHIEFRSDCTAVSLLSGDDGIAGVMALDSAHRVVEFRAAETVLATGGVGQLFKATSNVRTATGDGLAMALAVGASTAGLEFVQFHPTALRCNLDPLPLLTEALRGAGATLTANGHRFMLQVDQRAELAPRDIVARAVWERQQLGEDVLLDARAVFSSSRGTEFPAAFAACRAQGIDPAAAPIPVTCAAHFHMGGIVIDQQGRSSIPGLWAAGEVAFTGLHGANRLASNSLLEAVVIGSAAGRAIGREPRIRRPVRTCAFLAPTAFGDQTAEWLRLRHVMWQAMGPERDGVELARALAEVRSVQRNLPREQLILSRRFSLAEAMIDSALCREESRGAHWRVDFAGRNTSRDGARALFSF